MPGPEDAVVSKIEPVPFYGIFSMVIRQTINKC